MVENRCCVSAHRFGAASVIVCAGLAAPAGAGFMEVLTWTGGAGTTGWATPENWDPMVIPNNAGATTYQAVIPGAGAPTVVLSTAATVDGVFVGGGATLAVTGAGDLTLVGAAQPGGVGVGVFENDGLVFLQDGALRVEGENEWLTLRSASGTGVLGLSGAVGGLITADDAEGGVSNESGHRIVGGGALGGDNAELLNTGEIVADEGAFELVVDPDLLMTNAGLLAAEGDGVLRLRNGTYENAGGVIRAGDGAGVVIDGQQFGSVTISGGVIETEGVGAVTMLGNVFLGGLLLDGEFVVDAGDLLWLEGDLTNQGVVRVTSPGSAAQLRVLGARLLDGGGVVEMDGAARIGTQFDNNGRLINVDNTIRGAGNVGDDKIPIDNLAGGLLEAEGGDLLTIDPVNAPASSNAGVIRASGDGVIQLQQATWVNDDGVIEALDAGRINLGGGVVIVGGQLAAGPGASFVATNATLTDTALSGSLEVFPGGDLNLSGAIVNTGAITVDGTGPFTDLRIVGPVSLSGGGEVVLDGEDCVIPGAGALPELVNLDNLIRGEGAINVATLDNRGVIRAEDGELRLSAGQSRVNSGVLEAGSGGTLILAGNSMFLDNADGVLGAIDGGTTLVENFATISGGVLATSGDGLIRVESIDLTDVALDGVMRLQPGADVDVLSTFVNAGVVEMPAGVGARFDAVGVAAISGGGLIALSEQGESVLGGTSTGFDDDLLINVDNTITGAGQIGADDASFLNMGVILADAPAALTFDPSTGDQTPGFIRNEGVIEAIGANGVVFTGGPFTNAGVVRIHPGSQVARLQSDTYDQSAGLTSVDGLLVIDAGDGVLANDGGTVDGAGEVAGSLENAAIVSPGAPTGTLGVGGAYDQASSGTLLSRFDPASSGLGAVEAAGDANLAGTFVFSILSDEPFSPFTLAGRTVLSAAGLGGTAFQAALFDGLPGGFFLTLDYVDPEGSGPAMVKLALNQADGVTIAPAGGAGVPGVPVAAASADFDGVNGDDVALSLPGDPGSVVVLLSAGVDAGGVWQGFTLSQQILVGAEPRGLATGDFDADGSPDIAVALEGEDRVAVLRNDGAGIFGGTIDEFFVGDMPRAAAAADFDGDDRIDLAVANAGVGDSITVYSNAGGVGPGWDGLDFDEQVVLPEGADVGDLEAADLDADGPPELIAAFTGADQVGVLPNAAQAFGPPVLIPLLAGASPGSVEPGDLDNDKDVDIIVDGLGGSVTIVPSASAGAIDYGAALNLPVGAAASSAVSVNLDGDDDRDVAVIVTDGETGEAAVRILRNEGELVFVLEPDPGVAGQPLLLLAADVDADLDPDLVTISSVGGGAAQGAGPGEPVIAGALINGAAPPPPPACPTDLSGDGVTNSQDLNILLTDFGCTGGCVADVDADGDADSADLNALLIEFGNACR